MSQKVLIKTNLNSRAINYNILNLINTDRKVLTVLMRHK